VCCKVRRQTCAKTSRFLLALLFLCITHPVKPQSLKRFADSVRLSHRIPGLSYAVLSSSAILESAALGERKLNSGRMCNADDRYRIGSNTKCITAFIAAQLVKAKKISWHTRFFDLFPEMKQKAHHEYHNLTLQNLLTMRTRLPAYTYTNVTPKKSQFTGNEQEQRYQFMRWFFKQPPLPRADSVRFSNLGYVAAGLMLEKVAQKSYRQLVEELGDSLGIDFGFGPPCAEDSLQTTGHNADLEYEACSESHKFLWLESAGNINCTLLDYAKFIQLQLKGLHNNSNWLTQAEFDYLHYGLPRYAFGWLWHYNQNKEKVSAHAGNPGSFYTRVYIHGTSNRAYLIFCNVQSKEAELACEELYHKLVQTYN